jgi:hypothetical protein
MPMTSFLARYDHSFIKNLLLFSAIGFLLHVMVAIVISPNSQSDALDYHEHAMRLAKTHAYTTANGMATAYRPIGFPALLSFSYMIWPNMISGYLLQSLLVTISALLIALILKEHDLSNRMAYLGLIIYMLLPMTWLQSMTFMSEPLAIMAMLMSIYLRIACSGKYARFIEGICWGIAILTRPIMLFSLFGIILIAIMKKDAKNNVIALVVGIVIIMTPWMLRNALVLDSPMIASNTGINLLIGHNPEANGSYKYIDALNQFDGKPETQANAQALQIAIDNMLLNPLHSIMLIPKKIAFLFASDAYQPLQIIQNNGSNYRERVINLPLWSWLLIFPGAMVMFIGISHGGMLLRMHQGTMIIAIIAGMIVPCAIFFGTPRYHEPMISLLLIAGIFGYAQYSTLLGTLKIASFALVILWLIEYALIFFT